MTGLRHENIVRIYDYALFEDRKTVSLYMECCDASVEGFVSDIVSRRLADMPLNLNLD